MARLRGRQHGRRGVADVCIDYFGPCSVFGKVVLIQSHQNNDLHETQIHHKIMQHIGVHTTDTNQSPAMPLFSIHKVRRIKGNQIRKSQPYPPPKCTPKHQRNKAQNEQPYKHANPKQHITQSSNATPKIHTAMIDPDSTAMHTVTNLHHLPPTTCTIVRMPAALQPSYASRSAQLPAYYSTSLMHPTHVPSHLDVQYPGPRRKMQDAVATARCIGIYLPIYNTYTIATTRSGNPCNACRSPTALRRWPLLTHPPAHSLTFLICMHHRSN
ncbi:hypothetical protein EJ05DRAFT_99963 [Pseudovirgaria hyperparasitica]|uniref:Uncharacterized protein n=1 Tax=Pseudovirgaria hyperparasitica TaxID=470096 RepID=A0A6A6W1D2_9PEZI|nr:uncharacterized protein EJ05DRAFT_99963 [Pseudovirgaria hyperparasitica]KAF2755387.1 hypothetical protein EJ05DRAFT_99963 [Pseudovirgaria hyperparasitica]